MATTDLLYRQCMGWAVVAAHRFLVLAAAVRLLPQGTTRLLLAEAVVEQPRLLARVDFLVAPAHQD